MSECSCWFGMVINYLDNLYKSFASAWNTRRGWNQHRELSWACFRFAPYWHVSVRKNPNRVSTDLDL